MMNALENKKGRMLALIKALNSVDLSTTPVVVFYDLLKRELINLSFNSNDIEKILNSVSIDLSGLGQDVVPHMKFMNELAESYAKWIFKLHDNLEPVYGMDFVLKQVSKAGLRI